MRAEIIGPWVQAPDASLGGALANHPKVMQDFPAVTGCVDRAGTPGENIPPTPNLGTFEIEAAPGVILAINADPQYQVVWAAGSRDPDASPGAPEFNGLGAFLQAKGLTLPQVTALLGGGAGGRTRREIVAILRAHCRALPKGP